MTQYLLDAMRETVIHFVDPSTLNKDLVKGLQQKEEMVNQITEETLRAEMPDYDEIEADIAATYGSNYTQFILSGGDPKYMPQFLLPTLEIIWILNPQPSVLGDSVLCSKDTLYTFEMDINGGNILASRFDYIITMIGENGTPNIAVTPLTDVLLTDYHRVITFSIILHDYGIFNGTFKIVDSVDSDNEVSKVLTFNVPEV